MFPYLAVGIGGAIGSCLRYAITQLFLIHSAAFPCGTLLSNVIAGFLIGFILELDRRAQLFSAPANLFLTTGMLGGLSTFSTFSVETIHFFRHGKYSFAAANVLLNLSLSFLGVLGGMALAKLLLRQPE
ncbi:MAG: fluoride efflux transporter CrcB [Peptococcaceae bacterium]|jgi:CrcB protein|nr:fluoride efflux transporter CrcB [Peptococcaceae bacterium]